MRTTIAQRDLGACPVCLLRMEAGEWISICQTRGTAHTGCIGRPRSEGAAIETEPESSGYLFGNAEQATLDHAKEVLGVRHISFDGATAFGIDLPRLAGQLAKVFELMSDSKYRTLAQIAGVAGCLETSASARLRDLRKTRFGSHKVVSRQVAGSPLLYEYRLIVNERKEIDGRRNAA